MAQNGSQSVVASTETQNAQLAKVKEIAGGGASDSTRQSSGLLGQLTDNPFFTAV
jgi:hypothetical protein